MKDIRLVVVGAHALDAELMAGGAIARLVAEGAQATFIHMTRGERGHPTKDSETFAPQLEEEMKEAARVLAAQQIWLGNLAGNINPQDEGQLERLVGTLQELKPTHIITHWRGSWHPRHVDTHLMVNKAVAKLMDLGSKTLRGLYYAENCEDLDGFKPDLYVELSSENVSQWFQAVQAYELFRLSCKPETEGIPYNTYYRSAAKVRGLECGVVYAQAFMAAPSVWRLAAREKSISYQSS